MCERRDGCLDLRLVVHRGCGKLDGERFVGRFEFVQECRVKRRSVGIDHERYMSDPGGNFLNHLQPFPDQWEVDEGEAGDVAARPRQAGHETLSDRIVDEVEYDRDGAGRLFQCCGDWRPASDDEAGCRMHQLRRVGSDSAKVSAGISVLNSNIAVLGPPERLEPLPKRNDAGQHFGIVLGVWMEERNTTHAHRLLGARRERPREGRGAEKRDELAPLHVPLGNRLCCNSLKTTTLRSGASEKWHPARMRLDVAFGSKTEVVA